MKRYHNKIFKLIKFYVLFSYFELITLQKIGYVDCAAKVIPTIDCTDVCNILSKPTSIETGQVAAKITLPILFQLTFKVQIASNNNGYLANILEIHSDSLQTTFLSISVEPYVNQINLIYMGVPLFSYGPPIIFSPDQYSTVTVTVKETSLTFTTDLYGRAYPIPKSVLSPKNTLYISSVVKDADHGSATGFIQAIGITSITRSPTQVPTLVPTRRPSGPTPQPSADPTLGPTPDPLCCASTSYYNFNWQSCNNAADPSVGSVTSCSTCMAYQCVDWTAGSLAMQTREEMFYNNTGNSVYFAVGSYGMDSTRAGNCYRVTTDNIDRDIIMQVVDQDYSGKTNNIRIQLANGGLGVMDGCGVEGTSLPQYFSTSADFGDIFSGWSVRSQCDLLPEYPMCGRMAQDNLRDLCRWSFDKGFRTLTAVNNNNNNNNYNPTVTSLCQVKCPSELWLATGLHRSDEITSSYTCGSKSSPNKPIIPTNSYLTRMMNCAKPHYASPGTTTTGKTFPGYSVVVPCRRDGYARINSIPTRSPTGLPSYEPSYEPTAESTYEPTMEPTTTPTNKPTRSPSIYPTSQPSNYSSNIRNKYLNNNNNNSNGGIINSLFAQIGIGLGIMIIIIITILCICEYSTVTIKTISKKKEKDSLRKQKSEIYHKMEVADTISNPSPNKKNNNNNILKTIFSNKKNNRGDDDMEVII